MYAISTIDEGIELLTGVKAGKLLEDGRFEEGTVHSLVQLKLQQFATQARKLKEHHHKQEQKQQLQSKL